MHKIIPVINKMYTKIRIGFFIINNLNELNMASLFVQMNIFADLAENIFVGSTNYKFCLIVKRFADVEIFGDKRK
jgi:hypothetical protein